MKEGRACFPDDLEAAAFVATCEASYNDAVRNAARRILSSDTYRMVTLSGPTCSGKTTTASRLLAAVTAADKDLHIISIDDFYYHRADIIRRAKEEGRAPDYETAEAIDLSLFEKTVAAIRRGGEVRVPTYDFVIGERTEDRIFRADEDDIFLFEGIQAIYPEVTEILGHADCLSMFIEAKDAIKINDKLFLPPEIRFFRRIVRDYKFRGSEPVFIFRNWEGVRKNELKNIYPHASEVDIHLDSTMAYGINMLKSSLIPLLTDVKDHPEFGSEARRMLDSLEGIEEISHSLLPANSVYHEFVG